MEPTARRALSGEIKVSWSEYGPAGPSVTCKPMKSLRQQPGLSGKALGATFQTVAGIRDKWLSTQTNSPHNVKTWISNGEQLSSTLLPFQYCGSKKKSFNGLVSQSVESAGADSNSTRKTAECELALRRKILRVMAYETVFRFFGFSARRASKPNGAGDGVLCGCRECRWLGGNALGNAPEDHSSGLLNGFQALAQEIGVSVPKLDVVLGCGSVLKSDRLADHKGHGFGFGLADLFGGQGAAVATMQHFVSDLMHERGELLGWLHP
jgi:hypothetical protein